MKTERFFIVTLILSFMAVTGLFTQNATASVDLNNDGVVNILDLQIVASNFGKTIDASQDPNPDVNGDGVVDILDLVKVASLFGDVAPDKTLIFGRGGDSITLDPSLVLDGESAKVCDMIFDTLVQYKENTTEIEPALAESWVNSADGLTWTFYLRRDVTFHDGTPFNAHVAAFSINRPNAQSSGFFNETVSHRSC